MDKMCGKHMECVEYTYIYIYINNRKKLNGIYVTFVVSGPSFMVVGPRKLDMKPNQPQCHQLPPATAGHCWPLLGRALLNIMRGYSQICWDDMNSIVNTTLDC